MNPSYNEREVLALLQEESTQKQGFEMIVAQYSEQLYWQIRRMVLSHEDANDLLQNTFIKAWINIDYFRAEARLSTWLYRIALSEDLGHLLVFHLLVVLQVEHHTLLFGQGEQRFLQSHLSLVARKVRVALQPLKGIGFGIVQ